MSVISTNIAAQIAQRNLGTSQSSLSTAMQRLSSGMRINGAKDDAVGQAIANRMSAQITGLAQAQRNANDGISAAQTAEGALTQINDNLQRVRELTVQAQNGTNSQEDLDSIQNEINQRLAEIDRISGETTFNGTKVLNADQSLTIQVGSSDGETISIDLKEINAQTLSLAGFNVSGSTPNTAATVADLTAGGFTSTAGANGTTAWSKVSATANNAATATDVLDSLSNAASVTYNGTNTGLGVAAVGDTYTYNATSGSLVFSANGATDAAVALHIKAAASASASGKATITATIGNADTTAVVDGATGNLTTEDGQTLYLDGSGNLTTNDAQGLAQATIGDLAAAIAADTSDADKITMGSTTFTDNGATIDVVGATIKKAAFNTAQAGTGFSTSNGYSVAGGGGGAVTKTSGGAAVYVDADNGALTTDLNSTITYYEQANGTITDGQGAQLYKDTAGTLTFDAATAGSKTANPLAVLDDALKEVDTVRSDLGAIQNRFDSAINNLKITQTNISAARSRIQDADYAVEVANMTKAQILQQAGTSILAQANQIPQSVLSLLG